MLALAPCPIQSPQQNHLNTPPFIFRKHDPVATFKPSALKSLKAYTRTSSKRGHRKKPKCLPMRRRHSAMPSPFNDLGEKASSRQSGLAVLCEVTFVARVEPSFLPANQIYCCLLARLSPSSGICVYIKLARKQASTIFPLLDI
jgi:hypothetical protein